MSGEIPIKMPSEMHGRNYVCPFIQNTLFPKMVPIDLLKHLVRQLENLSNEL